ncbi:MAG: SDR family oxidoreductase, partial [Rhodobacteraceae bacterium]|nr:SDR family oxidoreductase [Paracoccaceae bacterium]
NITSMAVKAPIATLGLSNSARAGLTGFVAGTARQAAPHGVTINNLLPGIHATDRSVSLDQAAAGKAGITPDQARQNREQTIPVRRYGTSDEFGATCAFLCSTHAAYIVGQNILHDGGLVNATL